ncbi:MAG: hypothetical protein AMXMBFR36_17840 [Acidobacteriota bacterium]
MKLVVVGTHPVQYQAPYLSALASAPRVDLAVLYAFLPTPDEQSKGFGGSFAWDVPVLDGYRWREIPGIRRRGASPHAFTSLSAPSIGTTLEEEAADAVLVTGWHSRVLVQSVTSARARRIPVLIRGDSNDLRRRPVWVRLAQRALFSRIRAFLAVGVANRRLYEARGVAPDAIFSAPHAVDNARFSRAAGQLRSRRRELREAWGIPPDDTVLLFAGKLESKKRPADLLDALGATRRERLGLRVLIAGSGQLESDLRRQARDRRLPVTFAGFLNQTEMPRAYAAADALVLPSDAGETWGLVVNEAMASGLPAIVSDRVGCREDLVEEGTTGFSFPCGDALALSACMSAVASDPERMTAMGEAARRRVESLYSVERAVEGTVRAVEAVASKRLP